MNEWPPEFFLAIWFPLFIGLWISVSFVLSHFGWWKLAQVFAASEEPEAGARRFRRQSLGVGRGLFAVSYGSCINGWMSTSALYLRPVLLFRLFHPLLRVPRSEISSVGETGAIFKRARIKFRRDLPDITVAGKMGAALLAEWRSPVGTRGVR